MKLYLGIDPGLSGALALLDDSGGLRVQDMPTLSLARGGKTKREIDVYALARILDEWTMLGVIEHAVLEKVGAMPGQGVSSMFAFGQAFGIARMAVASCFIPITLVPPQTWKSALRVTAEKDSARARASELLPAHNGLWTRAKDDGRAEAAMMALYCKGVTR
jgi:crossover junction endodeoxyribonuclease RuvC